MAASVSARISAFFSSSVRCAIGDRLFGQQALLLGCLPGLGLGDRRVLEHAGGLGPAEVLQVAALGDDVLELEGVEHQTLVGHGVLGLLRDVAGERGPIPDDLLDGEPADDRAQRAGEHLPGELLDLGLLVQEPLGGGADRVLGAADLDDRDALQVGADALLAHRTRDLDVDAAAGQVHDLELLHDRQHEHGGAHDDLLAGQVVGAQAVSGLDPLALAAGDDEGLVGPGHLDSGDND